MGTRSRTKCRWQGPIEFQLGCGRELRREHNEPLCTPQDGFDPFRPCIPRNLEFLPVFGPKTSYSMVAGNGLRQRLPDEAFPQVILSTFPPQDTLLFTDALCVMDLQQGQDGAHKERWGLVHE